MTRVDEPSRARSGRLQSVPVPNSVASPTDIAPVDELQAEPVINPYVGRGIGLAFINSPIVCTPDQGPDGMVHESM